MLKVQNHFLSKSIVKEILVYIIIDNVSPMENIIMQFVMIVVID